MIFANIALPAFFPHSLATLVGLFLIAAVEAFFLTRILAAKFPYCYRASLSANLKSTFIGIPLAWALWTIGLLPIAWGLSMLGMKTHPLVPMAAMQTAFTGEMIPTEWTTIGSAVAWLVLLLPFSLASICIERRTILKWFSESDTRRVSKAVILGNLTTYSMFFFLGVYGLLTALLDYPHQKERFDEFRKRQEEYRHANKAADSERG